MKRYNEGASDNLCDHLLRQHPLAESETEITLFSEDRIKVKTLTGQFLTEKQRAANRIHEVPYLACFKPALPSYFIEQLTEPKQVVYDPFMGRGTTLVEAALLGRIPYGNDANPLSAMFVHPRLNPPTLEEVEERLQTIDVDRKCDYYDEFPKTLLVFYHPQTLKKLSTLKKYLLSRQCDNTIDNVDQWIRLAVLTRLSGHSPGFFSRYSLPPNLAALDGVQERTNRGVYLFSKEEIRDPVALARRLVAPASEDRLSCHLATNLPEKLAKLCSAIVTAFPGVSEQRMLALRSALASHLNVVIQSGDIFDPDIFAEVKLSERAARLLRRSLKGTALHYRNRHLLFDALPDELIANPKAKERYKAREKSVRSIVLSKTRRLCSQCDGPVLANLRFAADHAIIKTGDARQTPEIPDESVSLVVTSPPFLDVVDYLKESRLRHWFAGVSLPKESITTPAALGPWQGLMTSVFKELLRVVRPGGHVVFEVGEVRNGRVKLEAASVPCGVAAGFKPLLIMINQHEFSKTTNINGNGEVANRNRKRGTNTNRVVVFRKPTS